LETPPENIPKIKQEKQALVFLSITVIITHFFTFVNRIENIFVFAICTKVFRPQENCCGYVRTHPVGTASPTVGSSPFFKKREALPPVCHPTPN